MKRKNEFIVGLTTIIALILLILITINVKKTVLFSRTYELKVFFKQIKGLEVGAPVLVYGVISGQVKEVNYQSGQYPVMVMLRIKHKVKIYRNAIIRVTTAGMIGEARIEIDAGTPDTGMLVDGDDINGSPTMDFTQVLEMTPEIMRNMSDTIKSIKKLFDDEKNQTAFSNSLGSIQSLTSKLDDMVGTDTKSLKEIMNNLNSSLANLNDLLKDAKGVVHDSRGNIVESSKNLNNLLVNTDKRSAEFFTNLDETLNDTKQILEKIDATIVKNQDKADNIITNLEQSSQKINNAVELIDNGNGTVSLLLKDPQPFYDLRDALVKIKKILGEEEKVKYEYDIDFRKTNKQN